MNGFYTINKTDPAAAAKPSKHISDGQYIIATLVDNVEADIIYYTQNNIGSTVLLTGDEGELVQGYLYTPFGELWAKEDGAIIDTNNDGIDDRVDRLFTGQMYDKESGLYYMNARYYDPDIGTFMTADPAMSGLNHYAYASCNPIKYTDPTGMDDENGGDWGGDITTDEVSDCGGDEAGAIGGWLGAIIGSLILNEVADPYGYSDLGDYRSNKADAAARAAAITQQFGDWPAQYLAEQNQYYHSWMANVNWSSVAAKAGAIAGPAAGVGKNDKNILNGQIINVDYLFSYPIIVIPIGFPKEYIDRTEVVSKGNWRIEHIEYYGPEKGNILPLVPFDAYISRDITTNVFYTQTQDVLVISLDYTSKGPTISAMMDVIVTEYVRTEINVDKAPTYHDMAWSQNGAQYKSEIYLQEIINTRK